MIQPLLIPTAAEKRIDTDFYVEGYATTFDKPYLLYEWDGNKYYERIDRNALAGADMSDVIMQYNHEGKVLARLSNGTLGVEANDNGLSRSRTCQSRARRKICSRKSRTDLLRKCHGLSAYRKIATTATHAHARS